MELWLELLSQRLGVTTQTLILGGLASGALLVSVGAFSALGRTNPAAARLAAHDPSKRIARQDKALLFKDEADIRGLMKAFVPSNRQDQSKLKLKLHQAGFTSAGALKRFTFVRVLFGLLLPLLFIVLAVASRMPGTPLPGVLVEKMQALSILQSYIAVTLLIALGYLAPMKYLDDRIAARRKRIENGFPNALDLMRISVEAGLGFDAAMTRVGNELTEVSPELAFEFLTVQRQIAAGRPREDAMRDMADRTGVDTVRSFTSVVKQSILFGSSISTALTTYADELREQRETRAQEMANKLPVKMSGVLGALMLPALIILTAGPTLIRYIEMFRS